MEQNRQYYEIWKSDITRFLLLTQPGERMDGFERVEVFQAGDTEALLRLFRLAHKMNYSAALHLTLDVLTILSAEMN